MCNLYDVAMDWAEIADFFGVAKPPPSNTASDIYPGYPSMVLHEVAGERVLQSMVWGFPLPQLSKKTGKPIKPKPVNNIANLDSPMWRGIKGKPEHRCLIPLNRFAEAEGPEGGKTRTWITIVDQPIAVWAGMWRPSQEWGPVFSGMMRPANEAVSQVHDRMPVLLFRDDWDRWLHGTVDDVLALRDRPFPDELIRFDRTSEPWAARRVKAAG